MIPVPKLSTNFRKIAPKTPKCLYAMPCNKIPEIPSKALTPINLQSNNLAGAIVFLSRPILSMPLHLKRLALVWRGVVHGLGVTHLRGIDGSRLGLWRRLLVHVVSIVSLGSRSVALRTVWGMRVVHLGVVVHVPHVRLIVGIVGLLWRVLASVFLVLMLVGSPIGEMISMSRKVGVEEWERTWMRL